jgi:hypothetical protein
MPEMAKYSKAYIAEQFRRYPAWSEQTPPATVATDGEDDGAGETVEYYFLHDNYVVTSGIFRDERIAFDAVTDEWKQFCHESLNFDPNGADGTHAGSAAARS